MLRLGARRTLPAELPAPAHEFWAAVRSLPAAQAQVVALHYVEDRSVDDIARVLDVAPGTVKTHLFRARRRAGGAARRRRRRRVMQTIDDRARDAARDLRVSVSRVPCTADGVRPRRRVDRPRRGCGRDGRWWCAWNGRCRARWRADVGDDGTVR